MLRGTRENISFLASISNCAGVIALCFLLLATTVVISPQANLSPLSQSAFAQQADEEGDTTETGAGEQTGDQADTLSTLKTVVDLTGVTDTDGLAEIAGVTDSDQLAQMAGASDSEELAQTPGITSPEALDAIAEVPDLKGLAELVGVSPDQLPDIVLPEIPTTDPPTEEPPTTDPPTDGPPSTDALTAGIISNETVGDAPATFEFKADIAGGTEPYTYNWNFGDDSQESDKQTVSHTFDEAGTYTVTLTATDADGETASDTLEVTVNEPPSTDPPTDGPPSTDALTAGIISNETVGDAPATFEFKADIARRHRTIYL